MQGINKARHEHLINALHQLQRLLNSRHPNDEAAQQTVEHCAELQQIYLEYERLLTEVARQVNAYEDLFGQVKGGFLGKKLKELKKTLQQAPANMAVQNAADLLVENIHLAYGA